MTRHFNVLLITCALLLCARAESRVPEYVIVDVGPGDELAGINERQDLLVSFQGADAPHTGIYHRNGKFTDISLLPGMGANCGFSYLPGPYLIGGGGINDRGEAVVTIYFDDEVHDVQLNLRGDLQSRCIAISIHIRAGRSRDRHQQGRTDSRVCQLFARVRSGLRL